MEAPELVEGPCIFFGTIIDKANKKTIRNTINNESI